MEPIEWILLAGAVLAGAYVSRRLTGKIPPQDSSKPEDEGKGQQPERPEKAGEK